MENLSANQRWKRSGTTLPFKEWINRENEKAKANADVEGSFIPYSEDENTTQFSAFDSNNNTNDTNQLINDTIKSTFNPPSVKTQEDTKQVLGLDKKIFIFSSLLILGSLSFYFYKKLKAKK